MADAAGVAAGGESGETGGKDLLYARLYRDGKSLAHARAQARTQTARSLSHTHKLASHTRLESGAGVRPMEHRCLPT